MNLFSASAAIVILGGFSIAANPASPPPEALDQISTFSFSQSGISQSADSQICQLGAQLNIRTFSSWQNGTTPSEYNKAHRTGPEGVGIIATGGLTASVVFRAEAPTDSAFLDWISRDANGDTLSHPEIVPGAFRGNLASPGFRHHVLQIAKAQIEFGTAGIFFDEVNSGFDGGRKWNFNGNEGYDDHHLKEFNRFLLDKYPSFTKADFLKAFAMASDNSLDPDKPWDDLALNFNYRKYLKSHGWHKQPRTLQNPLAKLYGVPTTNRMALQAENFLESSNTRHWQELVLETRAYAASRGASLLVTSNGIAPFVDFHSVGLYPWNKDDLDGSEVDYVPVVDGKLDLSRSMLPVFRRFRAMSDRHSQGAPVVFFLDWPTDMMSRYNSLATVDKMRFWRYRSAEALAAGTFFSYHLRTSIAGDPTATQAGILDSLRSLVEFQKENSDLFHKIQWDTLPIACPASIVTSTGWQASHHRRIVHILNHDTARFSGTVRIPLDTTVKSVQILSENSRARIIRSIQKQDGAVEVDIGGVAESAILVIDVEPRSSIRRREPGHADHRLFFHTQGWSAGGIDIRGRPTYNAINPAGS